MELLRRRSVPSDMWRPELLKHFFSFNLILLLVFNTGCRDVPEPPAPGIVLITVDTLRSDHLGCYGYPENLTPTIDRISCSGVLFTSAIAQRGLTWPSLASIMTSQYPVTHGVRDNGIKLKSTTLTIPQILHSQGYYCAAFLANCRRQNWQGFDDFYKQDILGRTLTDRAIEWIKKFAADPLKLHQKYFLWIHYLAPHAPYTPPAPFDHILNPDYNGPINGSAKILRKISLNQLPCSSEVKRHVVDSYDGEIAFIDREINRILVALSESRRMQQSLIVLSADHGEDLCDHNDYLFHLASIYESTLRIPLVFLNCPFQSRTRIIDHVVESIDIAPTILDAVHIRIPSAFQGKSTKPLFLNGTFEKNFAVSEYIDKILAMRTADYKYIFNPTNHHPAWSDDAKAREYIIGNREFYNLESDPGETQNLIDSPNEDIVILEKMLRDWQAVYGWELNGIKDKKEIKDLELRHHLKALGYVL